MVQEKLFTRGKLLVKIGTRLNLNRGGCRAFYFSRPPTLWGQMKPAIIRGDIADWFYPYNLKVIIGHKTA
jgi:hypothetical protein